jgi:hypothetical protein
LANKVYLAPLLSLESLRQQGTGVDHLGRVMRVT